MAVLSQPRLVVVGGVDATVEITTDTTNEPLYVAVRTSGHYTTGEETIIRDAVGAVWDHTEPTPNSGANQFNLTGLDYGVTYYCGFVQGSQPSAELMHAFNADLGPFVFNRDSESYGFAGASSGSEQSTSVTTSATTDPDGGGGGPPPVDPPPPTEGDTIFIDLAANGNDDVDSGNASYVYDGKIWAATNHPSYETFEGSNGEFEWIVNPPPFGSYVAYRLIHSNGMMQMYFDRAPFGSATTAYLTIRYKDDCLQSATRPVSKIWSPGHPTIGEITHTFDHKWRTVQFTCNPQQLEVYSNGRYRILWGEAYDAQFAGTPGVDKIQLSLNANTSGFPADAQGHWPVISEGNQRFREIGRDNECVPGEGPFFPYGGYSNFGLHLGADFSEGNPSSHENDQTLHWQQAYFNAIVEHDWGDEDWDTHKTFDSPIPGCILHELGFAKKLDLLNARGLKYAWNALGGTRSWWIENDYGNCKIALDRHGEFATRFKDHPGIWCHYPVDELDHEGQDYNKPFYYQVQLQKEYKDNDPNTPVMSSSMGFPGLISAQIGGVIGDIVSNDSYFVDNGGYAPGGIVQVSRLSDLYTILGDDRMIISIPSFVPTVDGPALPVFGTYRCYSIDEMLWQAWYSICGGAQGIMWFDLKHRYYDVFEAQGSSSYKLYKDFEQTWLGATEVGRRLFNPTDGVAHTLISPWTTVDFTRVVYMKDEPLPFDVSTWNSVITVSKEEVFFMCKQNGGNKILFAVLMSETPVSCTFTIPGMSGGSKTVVHEGRTVSASGGQFTDSFSRLEVHTYIIEGSI